MKILSSAVLFSAISIICHVLYGVVGQECIGGELTKSGLSRRLTMRIVRRFLMLGHENEEVTTGTQPKFQHKKEMIWDQELASRAQSLANKCTMEPEEIRVDRKGNQFSQYASQRDKTWTGEEGQWEAISQMISEWFGESSRSSPGDPYSPQYFNQVGPKIHRIGCGYSEYQRNGKTIALFVCNYVLSRNESNIFGASCDPTANGTSNSSCSVGVDIFQNQNGNTGYQQLNSWLTNMLNGESIKQYADSQLVRTLQGIDFPASSFDQFKGFGARNLFSTYQSLPWTDRNLYQQYYYDPQNMAFPAAQVPQGYNQNGYGPSNQIQTSGLPVWLQGNVPGYETFLEPNGINIPRPFLPFQSQQNNPNTFSTDQYQLGLAANPSASQVASSNLGGFVQSKSDMQTDRITRTENPLGLPSAFRGIHTNEYNQPSLTNTQGFSANAYGGLGRPPTHFGLDNSSFTGMNEVGKNNINGKNVKGFVTIGMDSMGHYNSPFMNSLGSKGEAASNQADTGLLNKGPSNLNKLVGKPKYLRKH